MRAYLLEHYEYKELPSGGVEIISVKDKSVTEAVLPEGVVVISADAFYRCRELVTVHFPLSLVSIGENAFYGCDALDEVRYAGDKAGWRNLRIEVGNSLFSTVFVTFESEACDKDGGDFVAPAPKVEQESRPLIQINIGKTDIKGMLKKLGAGFKAFPSLFKTNVFLRIVLPSLLGVSLITGALLFFLVGRNYGRYEDEGFYCTAKGFTVTLDRYNVNTSEVTIPDGIDVIENRAFSSCTELMRVTIPDSVTSIGDDEFAGFSNLTSINVDPNNRVYTSIDGNLYSKDGKTLVQYATGKTATEFTIPTSVKIIGNYAFSGCSKLTSITIPDSVTSIGEHAFYYCTSLTSITIPESVTSIEGNAFYGCFSLANVYYAGSEAQWNDLQTNISDGNESLLDANTYCRYEVISNYFITQELDGLRTLIKYTGSDTDVVIPDGIEAIGDYAFSNRAYLTSITIPNGVTSIGRYAFNNCAMLSYILLPDSLAAIEYYAFYGCKSLSKVEIPGGVSKVGNGAFYGCVKVTELTLSDGVNAIGESAFQGCDNLTKVYIADSVSAIGADAFRGCFDITNVYYTGTEEQWNAIEGLADNARLKNATVHYNYIEE